MNSCYLQYLNIVLVVFLGIVIFIFIDEFEGQFNYWLDKDILQVVKFVDLDWEFDFVGEFFFMDNFDVCECFDWELLVNIYWYSSILFNLKNVYKFFFMIE